LVAPLLLVDVMTVKSVVRGGCKVGILAAAPLLVANEMMVTTNITNTSSTNELKHWLWRLTLTVASPHTLVDLFGDPFNRHPSLGSPATVALWHLRGGVLAATLTAICSDMYTGRRIK
jgi:hypothetical protein